MTGDVRNGEACHLLDVVTASRRIPIQRQCRNAAIYQGDDMTKFRKLLLVSAICAVPVAAVHAENKAASSKQGEVVESPMPAKHSPPTKAPNTAAPMPTPTAQGEAPASSVPGTDKPASTNTPQTMHRSDVPANTAPPPGPGTANKTAPSGETPPAGAPMRTGADSGTNEGAGTIMGTDKK